MVGASEALNGGTGLEQMQMQMQMQSRVQIRHKVTRQPLRTTGCFAREKEHENRVQYQPSIKGMSGFNKAPDGQSSQVQVFSSIYACSHRSHPHLEKTRLKLRLNLGTRSMGTRAPRAPRGVQGNPGLRDEH